MMSIFLPQVAAIANTVSWIKLGICVAAVLILVFILAVLFLGYRISAANYAISTARSTAPRGANNCTGSSEKSD